MEEAQLDKCFSNTLSVLQLGGSGVLVQPMTYIFDEEPLRWQRLLEGLGASQRSAARRIAAGARARHCCARCCARACAHVRVCVCVCVCVHHLSPRACHPHCTHTHTHTHATGLEDVTSKEPEAVAAYIASNGGGGEASNGAAAAAGAAAPATSR
jgi:hypothetical protein